VALVEPALLLFLLFLQEIISYGLGLRRRNPGVPAERARKEQRGNGAFPGVNPCKSEKVVLAACAVAWLRVHFNQIAILRKYYKVRDLSKSKRDYAQLPVRAGAAQELGGSSVGAQSRRLDRAQ
jgi:hypothetical protein